MFWKQLAVTARCSPLPFILVSMGYLQTLFLHGALQLLRPALCNLKHKGSCPHCFSMYSCFQLFLQYLEGLPILSFLLICTKITFFRKVPYFKNKDKYQRTSKINLKNVACIPVAHHALWLLQGAKEHSWATAVSGL